MTSSSDALQNEKDLVKKIIENGKTKDDLIKSLTPDEIGAADKLVKDIDKNKGYVDLINLMKDSESAKTICLG